MGTRTFGIGLLLAAIMSHTESAIQLLKTNANYNMTYAFSLALHHVSPAVDRADGATLLSAIGPFFYILGTALVIAGFAWPAVERGFFAFLKMTPLLIRAVREKVEWKAILISALPLATDIVFGLAAAVILDQVAAGALLVPLEQLPFG